MVQRQLDKNDLNELQRQHQRYVDLGLTEQAEEWQRKIDALRAEQVPPPAPEPTPPVNPTAGAPAPMDGKKRQDGQDGSDTAPEVFTPRVKAEIGTHSKRTQSERITLGEFLSRRMREAALAYARQGIPVFPLAPRSKVPLIGEAAGGHGHLDATTDEAQITNWWTDWPDANIGIPGSVITWLDVDPGRGGQVTLRRLLDKHSTFPKTVMAITGSGGFHYGFRHKQGLKAGKLDSLGYPGLEIKNEKGYIVAAPSIHPTTGRPYVWSPDPDAEVSGFASEISYAPGDDERLSPFEIPAAEMPDWLVEICKNHERSKSWNRDGERIPKGVRDDYLTSLGGTLRMRGMSDKEIFEALWSVNVNRCDPPLERKQVEKIAHSLAHHDQSFDLTELGNAKRLIHRHGENIRYVQQWKRWLIWDGSRWQIDHMGEIYVLAEGAIQTIVAEAAAETDSKRQAEKMKWYKSSQSDKAIKAMVDLAEKTGSDIKAAPEDFDRDPWLLNVQNGTIDLKSGELHEPRREDYLTMMVTATYNPQATAPKWRKFLERVLPDTEVRDFVQRLVGYTMTGDTREEILPILYGIGQNGKSTLVGTVRHMLGSRYAVNTPPSTFLQKQQDGIRNDLARLKTARMVTAIETTGGRRLAESLIKAVTGRDTITARFMYAEFFDFMPTFKLFLVVNHRPIVDGGDPALWRRILLVPFDIVIPDSEKDDTLKDALRDPEEQSGILNWCIEGCLEWQKSGLNPPAQVRAATEEYRDEMDRRASARYFIEQCCAQDSRTNTPAGTLYEGYKQWCGDEITPVAESEFGKAMKNAGYKNDHLPGSKRSVWLRVRLNADAVRAGLKFT